MANEKLQKVLLKRTTKTNAPDVPSGASYGELFINIASGTNAHNKITTKQIGTGSAIVWSDDVANDKKYAIKTELSEGLANKLGKTEKAVSATTADSATTSVSATTAPWDGIAGKPTKFTPDTHSHVASDITGGTFAAARIPSAIKVNSATTATSATTAVSATTAPWGGITGKPTGYTPTAHTHKPEEVGLESALKYHGVTTSKLTDGSTEKPILIGGINHYQSAGCVVIYTTVESGDTEFVWNGESWDKLGDGVNYKVKQIPVSDPTASSSALTFIDSITQDANGVIKPTKKAVNLSNYSVTSHTHSNYSVTGHNHDDLYYTESEMNTKLAAKSDTGHTHSQYLTGYTEQYKGTITGVTAGNGLTGGGTKSTAGTTGLTLHVGAGTGINVSANAVEISTEYQNKITSGVSAYTLVKNLVQEIEDNELVIARVLTTINEAAGFNEDGTSALENNKSLTEAIIDLQEKIEKVDSATTSVSATTAAKAVSDGNGNNIANTYATKTSIPTSGTVSGWGFTKNDGTVTSVKVRGTNGLTGSGTVIASGTISISGVNATSATTGVSKLITGDLKNKTGYTAGEAAAAAHTHSQYLTGYTDTKNTAGSTNSTSKLFLIGATGQTSSIQTYSNANVYMSGGSLYASSDERLKTFIENVDGDPEKIKQIPKVIFHWNTDKEKKRVLGTFAQGVEKVYPEIITKDEDDIRGVAYDRIGVIALAGIDKLYELVQQLQTKNEELEKRIKDLENK